jgi:hypothetical protein
MVKRRGMRMRSKKGTSTKKQQSRMVVRKKIMIEKKS